MADSSLTAIRTKVRRLTRSPSDQIITNAQIDEYVNTFVLYDFPEHLRLFDLRRTFTFYTIPNVDEYSTVDTPTTNQFYNFKNLYITTHLPVYVSGYKAYFTQSRDEYFAQWPKINFQNQFATGDAVTAVFTGTLTAIPVLQNNVLFSSIGTEVLGAFNSQVGLSMVDKPVVDASGNPTNYGNLYAPGSVPAASPTVIDATNNINYVTGVFTVTFPSAPIAQAAVQSQTVPYVASRPTSVLYFNNTFTVRPVPNISYPIQCEVYVRPTELLATNQSPELEQWWQYIAYGASKKVFEDRTDIDSVNQLMPEYLKQEKLVLRKTLVQQGDDRSATIYSGQSSLSAGPWGWGGNWWY